MIASIDQVEPARGENWRVVERQIHLGSAARWEASAKRWEEMAANKDEWLVIWEFARQRQIECVRCAIEDKRKADALIPTI